MSELSIKNDESADTGILEDYIIGRDLHDPGDEFSETSDYNSDSDHTGAGNTTCAVGDCEKHTALEGANNSVAASYFGTLLLLLLIAAVVVSS
ncbi:hypothetical protein LSM04_005033 [Trypanosoma melophagium]|uniref:uncharacterized protein n=1 Tax=Trypanosoma melophagium TaxID=715481 RepID=UPI003519F866|nr:hypothetical protein LSM04_005033 [Trypanosoma melophagium]